MARRPYDPAARRARYAREVAAKGGVPPSSARRRVSRGAPPDQRLPRRPAGDRAASSARYERRRRIAAEQGYSSPSAMDRARKAGRPGPRDRTYKRKTLPGGRVVLIVRFEEAEEDVEQATVDADRNAAARVCRADPRRRCAIVVTFTDGDSITVEPPDGITWTAGLVEQTLLADEWAASSYLDAIISEAVQTRKITNKSTRKPRKGTERYYEVLSIQLAKEG